MAENTTPKPKPKRVISAEEVAARLEEVETLLASCVGTRTVERVLSAKWGIGHRMVRRYIERVKTAWRATADATKIDARRDEIDAITKNCMARMASEGQWIGVMRGAELLARLHGVEAPKRLEHSGTRDAPPIQVVMTAAERDALAREEEGGHE